MRGRQRSFHRLLDLEDDLFLWQEFAVVLEPSLDEELFLTLRRFVVDHEMMMVLKPVVMLIFDLLRVDINTLLGLLLLDTLEEAHVRRILSQLTLIRLLVGQVDVPRQIPLTFEVHALDRQSCLRVWHAQHADVVLVYLPFDD